MEVKNLILNEKQVIQKIRRIAYEIYEHNFEEKALVLAGVFPKGFILAQLLQAELTKLSDWSIKLIKIDIDKNAPFNREVKMDCPENELKDKCIILIDDVLHTGRTFAYSLKPFMNINIKKMETAVLIDRSHKMFPISADYKGYELSTTINEHVEVCLEGELKGVFLH